MAQHSPSSGGTLTDDRLDRLLRALSDDRDVAAERYAFHAQRLAAYFRWQRCGDVEHLADEVMDRVARRLSEGEPIASVGAYALGVARLMVREVHVRATRHARVAREFEHLVRQPPHRDDTALACLDRCLGGLSPDRRQELLAYYSANGRLIDARKRMAATLGSSPAALRNRMLRLRHGLERCVMRCLAGTSASTGADEAPESDARSGGQA